MRKSAAVVMVVLGLPWGCAGSSVHPRGPEASVPSEAEILKKLGEPRPPATAPKQNEDVLIGAKEGLQSRKEGLFQGVKLGSRPDPATKYLWTIDDRGINIALELTPFPTPRGYITHTNISAVARFAGEAWFTGPHSVVLNGHSKRYGDRSNATTAQYEAALEYWERLGYEVTEVKLGIR